VINITQITADIAALTGWTPDQFRFGEEPYFTGGNMTFISVPRGKFNQHNTKSFWIYVSLQRPCIDADDFAEARADLDLAEKVLSYLNRAAGESGK
jgi:hypothetical protein